MALALCILILLLINSTKTVDIQPLPVDLSEILEKIFVQTEASKNQKINPADGTSESNSKDLFERSGGNESKSLVVSNMPNLVQQNVDGLESTNTDKVSPLTPTIIAEEARINGEILEDVTKTENSMPLQRRTNIEITDRQRPVILGGQISYGTRNNEKPRNHLDDVSQNYYPSIIKLNENFEKFLQQVNNIQSLRSKEDNFKLNNMESQYKSSRQLDDNMIIKQYSDITPRILQNQIPLIVQRNPLWYPEQYPQNMLIKSPSWIQKQSRNRSLVPKVQKILLHRGPIFKKAPTIPWSFQ